MLIVIVGECRYCVSREVAVEKANLQRGMGLQVPNPPPLGARLCDRLLFGPHGGRRGGEGGGAGTRTLVVTRARSKGSQIREALLTALDS